MLIETSGSNNEHDEEKLNKFLETAMSSSLVVDGIVTNEPSKMKVRQSISRLCRIPSINLISLQNIWALRERIADSLLNEGYCFKYDLSLPLKQFYEIVPTTAKHVGDLATYVCGYGHIGDSNLHLNVACEVFNQEIYKRIEPFVFEYTSKLKGSISAEHGIGFHKSKYLKYSKSSEAIYFMKKLKAIMDPNGILNPYKVLPDTV